MVEGWPFRHRQPLSYAQNPDHPESGMDADIQIMLERRLGRLHARQRLGIERELEGRIFGRGTKHFHFENWYSAGTAIRLALKACGLYGRGRRNADRVVLRENRPSFADLPAAFDGFAILHLSDLHVEMCAGAMARAAALVDEVRCDIVVLTGDFRGPTHGPYEATLAGLAELRPHLKAPVYAVLGNHDSIRMVPEMEAMGIRMLLNESEVIRRGDRAIHLAGIDDAGFYGVDNIQKAGEEIPHGAFAILLSHTPEVYRQAAHAGFQLMLSGHTHGGQICLPGGIPITLDARLPRRYGAGAWVHEGMAGYTSRGTGSSIVPVRFNCPPEVTLHRLRRAPPVPGPGSDPAPV
jgi:predicted MPP superfamily phosphohydrolase